MIQRPHFSFDMDGTIIDTSNFFEEACLTSFNEYQLPLTSESYREQFGTGKRTLTWLKEMGITDPDVIRNVISRRDEIMIALLETKTRWIDGALEALDRIRRRQNSMWIITNANNNYIAAVRRCLPDIDTVATHLVGPDTVGVYPKPDPGGILHALKDSGRSAAEFIYMGDQQFDLRGARNAGVHFCTIHKEYTHPHAVAEADYCVTHHEELLGIRLPPK